MSDRLISIDTAKPAGAQFRPAVTAELAALGAMGAPGFRYATGRSVAQFHEACSALISASAPAGAKPVIVAEAWGAGVLEKVWFAGSGGASTRATFTEDNGTIRIYLDNAATPAVSMPVNDFFCYGPRGGEFATPRVGRTKRSSSGDTAAYRALYAPFATYMRVEFENGAAADRSGFSPGAAYRLDSARKPFGSYAIKAAKNTAIAKYAQFTICDFDGAGQVESIQLAINGATSSELTFLEGNLEIYVDGEAAPSILASSTDAFFGGGSYNVPVGGYPAGRAADSDLSGSTAALYRFFPDDPIRFNSHLKVVAPIGQNGVAITPSTLSVSGSVGVWLDAAPASVPAKKADTTNAILADLFNYSPGALDALKWGVDATKTAPVVTGTTITHAYGSTTAYQDVWMYRKDLNQPTTGWIETKLRITSAGSANQQAGLLIGGASPTPTFASSGHVELFRGASANAWSVRCRDGNDTPFATDIGDGSDLTDAWVWLAVRVEGAKRTAYFKLDGALDWHPIGSWTAATGTGPFFGLFSNVAGVEFDQLNLYPLA